MRNQDSRKRVQTLVLAAMMMALGLVLPFLTGQIPQIGSMMLPMHLPVLLCGLICGWKYGAAVGFILPLLRMMIFGMPPLLTAVAMAFELAAYGAVIGLLYAHSKRQNLFAVYRALIVAMLAGRVVWGVVRVLMTGVADQAFTWQIFMAGAFANAIPGIVLQLVLIPAVMLALDKVGVIRFRRGEALAPGQGD